MLERNRVDARNLIVGEPIDQLSCLNSLKIQLAVEWLCQNKELQVVGLMAVKLFHDVLTAVMLGEEEDTSWVEDFSPFKRLLENILPSLGESFICRVPLEMSKLFERFVDLGRFPQNMRIYLFLC